MPPRLPAASAGQGAEPPTERLAKVADRSRSAAWGPSSDHAATVMRPRGDHGPSVEVPRKCRAGTVWTV